jgi:hypothetical protein
MNLLIFPLFVQPAKNLRKFLASLRHLGFSQLVQALQVDSHSEYLVSILSDTQDAQSIPDFLKFWKVEGTLSLVRFPIEFGMI